MGMYSVIDPTPGRTLRKLRSWPYAESCVMLQGSVAITDEMGGYSEYAAGDAFVVRKGFAASWTTVEPSRKYLVAMR